MIIVLWQRVSSVLQLCVVDWRRVTFTEVLKLFVTLARQPNPLRFRTIVHQLVLIGLIRLYYGFESFLRNLFKTNKFEARNEQF